MISKSDTVQGTQTSDRHGKIDTLSLDMFKSANIYIIGKYAKLGNERKISREINKWVI